AQGGALQQLDAGLELELANASAQRRLGEPHFLGRLPQAPAFGRSHQSCQLVEFHCPLGPLDITKTYRLVMLFYSLIITPAMLAWRELTCGRAKMKTVSSELSDWKKDHPTGSLAFKYLLSGDDGASDNFVLILARQDAHFATERHRHNFDQFRYPIRGDMN